MFFFALAVLNEIVWRTQTTDFWVSFKVFGVLPLTFVFAALQFPLMSRYAAPEPKPQEVLEAVPDMVQRDPGRDLS
jgi:intracellular septation protein